MDALHDCVDIYRQNDIASLGVVSYNHRLEDAELCHEILSASAVSHHHAASGLAG